MPELPPDDRSPMTVAMEWCALITTIGLEMALPAAGGYWLDDRLGTLPLFLLLGAAVGFAIGMIQLLHVARRESRKKP